MAYSLLINKYTQHKLMIMMADLDNMNFPKLCAIFSRVNLGGHKIEKMCTLSYESGF